MKLDPAVLIPWVLLGAVLTLFIAALVIALKVVTRYVTGMLAVVSANLTVDITAAQARHAGETKMMSDLTSTFTEALATLARATAVYVAGDTAGVTSTTPNTPRPQAPTRLDQQLLLDLGISATELPEGEVYVDWTDGLAGLEGEPDARARFIPPGASPVDVIRGAHIRSDVHGGYAGNGNGDG